MSFPWALFSAFLLLVKTLNVVLFGTSLGLVLTNNTWASSIYPRELRAGLGLDETPSCTLCHRTSRGGPNTATLPFAESLKDYGLEGKGDEERLRLSVLAALDAAVDSDQDGTPDAIELILGSSPNDPSPQADSGGMGGAATISASVPWREGPTSSGDREEGAELEDDDAQSCSWTSPSKKTFGAAWISPLLLLLGRQRRGQSSGPSACPPSRRQ